jgi:ammonia channel protein AmtB
MGLRASPEAEQIGIDVTEHAETAYALEIVTGRDAA